MIVGSTNSNVRALIEERYKILSQMISDIAEHYQNDSDRFDKRVVSKAIECSHGDYEEYSSIIFSFNTISENYYLLASESRKILFCSIYSYFETMLFQIANYYEVSIGNTNQIKQLVEKLRTEYKTLFGEELNVSQETELICDFYRVLRNYLVHGSLNSPHDLTLLQSFVKEDSRICVFECNKYEITDNNFLIEALNRIKGFLICIEGQYNTKYRYLSILDNHSETKNDNIHGKFNIEVQFGELA